VSRGHRRIGRGVLTSWVDWVNYGASKNMAPTEAQWRLPFGMQILPGVLFLLAMLFQPESPRWLTEQGRLEQAERALTYINRTSSDSTVVSATLAEMQQDFEGRAKLSMWQQLKSMFANGPMIYRAAIPSLVMFFQQWTGTNAINYYSPSLSSADNLVEHNSSSSRSSNHWV
jgi:MFS family permease